jgi:zinc finger protein 362/384
MEHMRMDPKHQFAAQYMLSRAAAERRERDSILAAAIAGGSGLLSQIGQNSRGASPVNSEASSCNNRMTSPHSNENHVTDNNPNNNNNNSNNNNNNNNNAGDGGSDNNNNTNGTATNLSTTGNLNYNGKLSVNDVLRSPPGQNLHQQYQQVVAAAAANIVAQNQNSCNNLGSSVNPATSAAQAVANLAAVMRQNQPMVNGNQQSPSAYGHQNNSQMNQHSQQHHHHHQDSDAAMRIHQAEALLRSQAEAALRLAVSQAAAVVASSSSDPNTNNQFRHHNGMPYNNHHQNNSSGQLQSQFSPDLSEALRLQEQRLEQALRLHSSELGLHQQHHQQP